MLPSGSTARLLAAALVLCWVAGCASTITGSPVADPGATTTTAPTTTAAPPATTTTTPPPATGDEPVPGDGDLLDPTIAVAKTAPGDAAGFCGLVTEDEVAAALGLDVLSLETPFLCTAALDAGGTVFISGFGATSGVPIEIGGNSALLVDQNDGPGSCQVTVALSTGFFDVLDVDVRDVPQPPATLCDGARALAQAVFDALPNA